MAEREHGTWKVCVWKKEFSIFWAFEVRCWLPDEDDEYRWRPGPLGPGGELHGWFGNHCFSEDRAYSRGLSFVSEAKKNVREARAHELLKKCVEFPP